jgi:hypothetical protein
MERLIRAEGHGLEGMSQAEMDVYWERVKGNPPPDAGEGPPPIAEKNEKQPRA